MSVLHYQAMIMPMGLKQTWSSVRKSSYINLRQIFLQKKFKKCISHFWLSFILGHNSKKISFPGNRQGWGWATLRSAHHHLKISRFQVDTDQLHASSQLTQRTGKHIHEKMHCNTHARTHARTHAHTHTHTHTHTQSPGKKWDVNPYQFCTQCNTIATGFKLRCRASATGIQQLLREGTMVAALGNPSTIRCGFGIGVSTVQSAPHSNALGSSDEQKQEVATNGQNATLDWHKKGMRLGGALVAGNCGENRPMP